jgi:hypothetical protein
MMVARKGEAVSHGLPYAVRDVGQAAMERLIEVICFNRPEATHL